VGPELDFLDASLSPLVQSLFDICGCDGDCDAWYADAAVWARCRARRGSSKDGKHFRHHPNYIKATLWSELSLSSADTATRWLDALPGASSPTFQDVLASNFAFTSARTLVSEVLEREHRTTDAISFAQAEIADPFCYNQMTQIRAGRALARCHTALGQHSLSAAALDAALELAQTGQYLMQVSECVRGLTHGSIDSSDPCTAS